MVPLSRRRLLAATGTVALAGCLSRSDGDEAPTRSELEDATLPEDLATVLAATPDQVGAERVQLVFVSSPEPDEDEEVSTARPADGALGLEPATVDRTAAAQFQDYRRQLLVATGSFAAEDAGTDETEAAVYAEDGFAVLASAEGEPWDGGLDAATVARDDPDLGLLAQAPLAAVLEPIADETPLQVVPDFPPEDLPQEVDADLSDVDAAAATQENVDETTRETTLILLFSSADAVDRDVVDELVESGGQDADADDATVEEEGPRVVVTVEEPRPDHELPDDSPDLHAGVGNREGSFELRFHGDEPADTANLELRVDGEPVADPPWAGRDAVRPDETYELDAPRFSRVEVVWIDPERDDVEHSLGSGVRAPRDAFEASYDADAKRLAVTFVGEDPIDPAELELRRAGRNEGPGDPTPLEEYVDELTGGEEIVVENLEYGEHVAIQVARDDRTYGHQVFGYHAKPPGEFEVVREAGDTYLAYRGDEPRPAEHYEIQLEGELAATQFADEFDTLERGDRVPLDAEFGDDGEVRWTESEEPIVVQWFHVSREVDFEFDFREDADTVEVTRASGGEALDGDLVTVLVYQPETESDSEPDEHRPWAGEQVEAGDSAVVDLPEGSEVVVGVEFDGSYLDHDYPGEEPPGE